ncbi:MAG TPA: ABC transporter permease, partial [Thermomicrobiaceae bacterium]|nr:ABC transporter permease [Thermomicrobiaceae bacterium]
MTTDDAIRIAAGALSANKLRTFLTMLGVIIGVGAVIALVAVGQGAQNAVTARFAGLGANLLYIRPGSTTSGGVRSAAGTAPTLTMTDAQDIQQEVGGISAVVPESTSAVQLLYQGQNTNTRVTGTTPEYQTVMDWQVAQGSFFTDEDVSAGSPVLDLGATVAQTLFGSANPVGQTVRVGIGNVGLPFQVVGVMQAKGGTGLGNQDDQVVMPISTLIDKIQSARNANGGQQVSE